MSIPKLSPADRSALRAAAHALNPVVMVGDQGLTDAVIAEIDRSLAAHALIKIRVFGDDRESRVAIYDEICTRLSAAPVQHIGKLLVVWREGPAQLQSSDSTPKIDAARKKAAAAPRAVVIRKPVNKATGRKPRAERVKVLGNERVTASGNIKRAKPRQTSRKKQALD